MSDPRRQPDPGTFVRMLLAGACVIAVGAAQAQKSRLPSGSGDSTPATPVTATAPGLTSFATGTSTAAEIQRINERMTLLQAQLNELELQARISSKRKEIEATGATSGTAGVFDSKAGLPVVQSVAGLKGRLQAVLVFPGGVIQRVKAGDVIADRRVAKVSLNEVVLTDLHGKGVQRLAFGSAPPVRENTPAASTAPMLPAFASPVLGR